jgi:hypothetical protein
LGARSGITTPEVLAKSEVSGRLAISRTSEGALGEILGGRSEGKRGERKEEEW